MTNENFSQRDDKQFFLYMSFFYYNCNCIYWYKHMKCKIITLVENCVYGRKLQAEHGLSLYVEAGEHVVLFDTGASDLFVRNARFLHCDLQKVDYLVLSHGHSDHTGGLETFLDINKRAKVVCKREALDPKFKGERENGIRHAGCLDMSRFIFIDRTTEILPGVWLFPKLTISDEKDTHFEQFLVKRGGELIPDRFEDELALVLKGDEGLAVLSACSHRGITNILRSISSYFDNSRLKMLTGGFHIHNAPTEKDNAIIEGLKHFMPDQIGVCHCSGVDKFALFYSLFGNKVFYNHTGCVKEIEL